MQTSNRRVIIGGFVLLAMLMMVAMVGFAQEGRGNKGGFDGRKMHGKGHDGMGRFGRGLNLTEAQQAQMQQISDRYRESTKSLRDQLRSLHRNSAEQADSSFNEAAVRQAAQARANIEVELEVARARMKSEMYAVLTPEQKAQLAQQKQERQQRRQQRMNRRAEGNTTTQQ
jgi:protein CpxP